MDPESTITNDKDLAPAKSNKTNGNQNEYLPLRIVAVLMVALYLAMFLIALVCTFVAVDTYNPGRLIKEHMN